MEITKTKKKSNFWLDDGYSEALRPDLRTKARDQQPPCTELWHTYAVVVIIMPAFV